MRIRRCVVQRLNEAVTPRPFDASAVLIALFSLSSAITESQREAFVFFRNCARLCDWCVLLRAVRLSRLCERAGLCKARRAGVGICRILRASGDPYKVYVCHAQFK